MGGALARPEAGLGAFVRVFGAVVEAVCSGGVSGRHDGLDNLGGEVYPRQLSQRNGRKSRTWQYSIWQCAPTASTSPPFISVKVSEVMVATQGSRCYID